MEITEKRKKLEDLYGQYEKDVAEFKKSAVCVKGCAGCCIDVGNIDITTLEGIIIYRRLAAFEEPLKSGIRARLAQNRMDREKGRLSRCAFLREDKTCMIYDIRPFSCRRLYSVKRCDGGSPTIHRQALNVAGRTVEKIQQLDFKGYSGHISYILYLLDRKEFRKAYLRGRTRPQKIADFGRSHGILINRCVPR
ncbi:MAG: YkgJ family cysteine cluster protein [Thermodesulfobacteriota bacterium]|nr:MAG: YkgJ family cysteine cluster protein [Thermodesulfobacteriota bacterium]